MTEGHGDDGYRYDELLKMNFSSTIFQHADHTALQEHLREHFDVVSNYPEPQPRKLERLIAQKLGISPEMVLVTNGVTEAIYLIARLFHHSVSIIPQPTFSEYADACRINSHVISYETNEDVSELPKDRVYWICNPNNPSGNVLMKGFMDYVVRRSPRYTFVVDQSAASCTKEPLLVPRDLQGLSNVLLLHSISKNCGIPGIRLGYVTAHPSVIGLLRAMRHPWAVGSLAIEAGLFLVSHDVRTVDDLDAYLQETERLRKALRQIPGIRVFETKTNYMMCEIEKSTSAELKNYLIHEHGILIRDNRNFYGLSDHFFRISTQLPEENDALVAAVRQYMERKE